MNPTHRLLGAPLLTASILSLLLWAYIAARIVVTDTIDHWLLGMVAFVAGFTCMVLYLTFWWRNGFNRSVPSRFVRASLLTTGLYSLLLFFYVMGRVIISEVPINNPFITFLFPWFTFLRLAMLALTISLLSSLAYLIYSRGSNRRSATERSS